jgi:hypothetical protein
MHDRCQGASGTRCIVSFVRTESGVYPGGSHITVDGCDPIDRTATFYHDHTPILHNNSLLTRCLTFSGHRYDLTLSYTSGSTQSDADLDGELGQVGTGVS